MTIAVDLPKFKATIRHDESIGYREREVEFDVKWISCGVYQLQYFRPVDAEKHYVVVAEDWYPPNTSISFTPEQFDKIFELYPAAPKQERLQCYKPFYEDYTASRDVFDFGNDWLFQAYKDLHPNVERVYMVVRNFIHGRPTETTSVLGISWEDFLRLKVLLDSNKHEIFYSGVYCSGNPFATNETAE